MNKQIIKVFISFLKQLFLLDDTNIKLKSFSVLVNNVLESDKDKPCEIIFKTIKEFLEENVDYILKEPLLLKTYAFSWYSVDNENKKICNIDFMKSYTKADEINSKIIHCYILKMATLLYQDDKYEVLLSKLKETVPLDMNDPEKEAVDRLFTKMMDMQNKVTKKSDIGFFIREITDCANEFRRDHYKPKLIIKYLVEKTEDLIKDSDDEFKSKAEEFISELKRCDYNFTSINILKFIVYLQKITSELNKTFPGFSSMITEQTGLLSEAIQYEQSQKEE